MNRVEFMKEVRAISEKENWLLRGRLTSELIEKMQEVFDRLAELEMREDRNDYLMNQLHIQQQINFELEYNLGDEKYLEKRLEQVRLEKAEAKRALNAIFEGSTPADVPLIRRKEEDEV